MSRLAELLSVIQDGVEGLGGISPVPVPPDAAYPYITIEEIGDDEVQSMTGRSGLVRSLLQVSAWDKDYESAAATKEAIKALLLAFTPDNSHTIQDIKYVPGRDFYDDQRSLHKAISRFHVWFEAADL